VTRCNASLETVRLSAEEISSGRSSLRQAAEINKINLMILYRFIYEAGKITKHE
jgi:hypothetical protein